MPIEYLLTSIWRWVADTGLNIAIIVVLALLVPRAGRLATRILEARVAKQEDEDEGKGQLALGGVGVYVAQLIAYFLLLVSLLQEFGFSLAGAAIPATVVSAAIGFGAQGIIADFMAGFFIISEKQYGVGDWVAFEGNGIEIEGTVIQVTMRSTQIRTIDQSTVSIPNSTARICINRSHYWSRAVVVIPVPLLGSANAEEALRRSERATRRALSHHDVRTEVIGELDVHPAVNVNPPSTVGMPWTVDMRFMIQVRAGSQWLVERAIRMSILNEFWDEYGSATTVSGELIDAVHTAVPQAADNGPDTEEFDVVGEGMFTTGLPTVSAEELTEESATDSRYPDVPAGFDDGDGTDPAAKDASKDKDSDDEEATAAPSEESRWRRILTFGDRVRPSTTGLVLLLFVLLVLRGLSASGTVGDEHVSGVLAPPRATTSAPATPDETTSTPPRSPQTSAPASPADTTEPYPTYDTPEPSYQEPDSTQPPPETAPAPQDPATPEQTAPNDAPQATDTLGQPPQASSGTATAP